MRKNNGWWHIEKPFAPEAKQMRSHFIKQFSDPRQAHENRFVWDYWHIPDQYTAIRTPAYHYFPEKLYKAFHLRLVEWGRRHLGCHDISPPWLSYYVDGCGQELHADNPHGPWAFVFSLTDWLNREFSGGETFILKSEVLDYWQSQNLSQGLEADDLMVRIPAEFNQLLVFDPRRPHGVREVRGVKDPRQGRLVIHGWFVQPRPFVEGSVSPRQALGTLNEALPQLIGNLDGGFQGALILRLKISPAGVVRGVQTLVNSIQGGDRDFEPLRQEFIKGLKELRFPSARGESSLTLPLIFEV